jgi:hypothetical protein
MFGPLFAILCAGLLAFVYFIMYMPYKAFGKFLYLDSKSDKQLLDRYYNWNVLFLMTMIAFNIGIILVSLFHFLFGFDAAYAYVWYGIAISAALVVGEFQWVTKGHRWV